MKRNKILLTIITITALVFTTYVSAESYDKYGVLTGNVIFGPSTNVSVGAPAISDSYHWYNYNFHASNGQTYPAFCIDPDKNGSSSNSYTCNVMDPNNKFDYMIISAYNAHKSSLNTLEFNICMRAIGGMAGRGGDFLDGKSGHWRTSFVASFQKYSGLPESYWKASEGYIMTNSAAVTGFTWAAEAVRDADAKFGGSSTTSSSTSTTTTSGGTSGTTGSTSTSALQITETTGATGSIVKLDVQSVHDPKDGSPVTVIYTVTNVSGKNIEKLIVTPSGVTATLSWDKNTQTGTLKVTTSDENCNGTITITDGSTTSNPGTSGNTLYKCNHPSASVQDFIVAGPDMVVPTPGETPGDSPAVQGMDVFAVKISCSEKCDDCGWVPTKDVLKTPAEGQPLNNCCEEGSGTLTAAGIKKASQYGLQELFCNDNELGVQYSVLKCNAEDYKEATIETGYCEIYCSQALSYSLPGPTVAKSGRKFKLRTQNVKDKDGNEIEISGPHMELYLRCRTLIHWNKWYIKEKKNVEKQTEYYNKYAKNKAYENVWNDLISRENSHKESYNSTKTNHVTCTSTYNYRKEIKVVDEYAHYDEWGNYYDTTYKWIVDYENYDVPVSSTHYISDVQVRTYKFSYIPQITKYQYLILGVDANGEGQPNTGSHSKLTIKATGKETPSDSKKYYNKADADQWRENYNSARNDSVSDVDDQISNANYDPCGGSENCSWTFWSSVVECNDVSFGEDEIDPNNKRDEYKNKADSALDSLNGKINDSNELKEKLDKCHKYGELPDDESTAETLNFDIGDDPDMNFEYTQAYVDELGQPVTSLVSIPFEKTCRSENVHGQYALDGADGDLGIDDNKYSSKLGAGINDDIVQDIDASLLDGTNLNIVPKGPQYVANKAFTIDDLRVRICDWNTSEEYNKGYVLVPSGLYKTVEEETVEHYNNYTEFNDWYTIKKTHEEGEFESYFTFSNVGKDSYWDVFLNNGTTCSGHSEDNANATCKIVVEREEYKTGDCNNVFTRTDDPCKCEWKDDQCGRVYSTYEYKEVDPSDVFVNESVFDTGTVAYNWKNEQSGRDRLLEIEERGRNDTTYAPENITYSFTLTPSDLREIRSYNKERLSSGGYADFEFICHNNKNLPQVKCYSKFLNSISGSTEPGVSGLDLNTFNGNIDTLRNSNKVNWYTNICPEGESSCVNSTY